MKIKNIKTKRGKMRLLILFLIVVILISSFNFALFAEETINKMDIDNSVIRIINPKYKIINSDSPIYRAGSPWGSGFLINWENDLFIVTARHVAEADNDLLGVVRVKNKKNNCIERYKIKLPKDYWVFHPEEGNNNTNYVDVAIMKINWLEGFKIKTFDYNEDFLDEKILNDILINRGIEKAYILNVYWWTSDIDEAQLDHSRPIRQFAVLSEKFKELKLNKNNTPVDFENQVIVCKGDAFHGNSGGPVIDMMPWDKPKCKLLGLVVASDIDNFINYAGNKPLGLIVIEPITRIKETLSFARNYENEFKNDNWSPLDE
jgi:hypothetical protein